MKIKFSNKHITLILVFLFSYLSINQVSAYDEDHLEKVRWGIIILPYARLSCAPLWNINFNGGYYVRSCFSAANCNGASFKKANLENSDFYLTKLKNTNLTQANFKRCIMLGVDLTEATTLETNFQNVLGLTNDQKEYLRENKAIHIPDNLSPEDFDLEVQLIKELRRDPITKCFIWIFKSVKSCFKRQQQEEGKERIE